MAFQLPTEVLGVAAGVLTYSFTALICSSLMVWLVWSQQERTSYVAGIAYFTLLSTAASIVSQFHDFALYEDVMTAQWRYARAHPDSPEIKVSNGAIGLDLGLWYFRQYTYSVESLFVVFWAFSLMQSVYGLTDKHQLKELLGRINYIGKIVSVVLPILTICLLQVKAIQKSTAAFFFLANVVLMISLALGSICMVVIFVRYVYTRGRLVRQSRTGDSSTYITSRGGSTLKIKGIYDRWLLTRFTIAFIVLSAFELSNILFQLHGMSNSNGDAKLDQPDLSVERAHETAVLFLPGPAPSFLLFIVFGTTAQCRKQITAALLPKRWQRQKEEPLDLHFRSAQSAPRASLSNSLKGLRMSEFGIGVSHSDSPTHTIDESLPGTRPNRINETTKFSRREPSTSDDGVELPVMRPSGRV
ncbi:hypothetical protein F5X96DRAFT_132251 [Biscogniauxia mediterranea]|nr:hypothetical protein F5X96DRAFT_132251 [Biscogniauxia mediterranea]